MGQIQVGQKKDIIKYEEKEYLVFYDSFGDKLAEIEATHIDTIKKETSDSGSIFKNKFIITYKNHSGEDMVEASGYERIQRTVPEYKN